jgi:hypothetical protein
MEDADRSEPSMQAVSEARSPRATPVAALKPKGACWYCNQPLDNIRRFCSKECADDYKTEEEVFNSPAG